MEAYAGLWPDLSGHRGGGRCCGFEVGVGGCGVCKACGIMACHYRHTEETVGVAILGWVLVKTHRNRFRDL